MSEEMLNANAIEVLKLLTDEINHYRNRQFKTTVLHATLSVFTVYFLYTSSWPLEEWVKILAGFLFVVISIFFIGVVAISKVRGKYAKGKRCEILSVMTLPNLSTMEYNEIDDKILGILTFGITTSYILAIISFSVFTVIIISLH